MDTAIDISEILLYIGTFLSQRDAASCRLVNRAWSTAFAFNVFRAIKIPYRHLVPHNINQYTHLIHHLTFTVDSLPEAYQLEGMTQLKSLTFAGGDEEDDHFPHLNFVPILIKQHGSTLTKLEISRIHCVDSCGFWTMIEGACPRLETLVLDPWNMGAEAIQAMWRAICQIGIPDLEFDAGRLESCDLEGCKSKVQTLRLWDPYKDLGLQIMRLSPELRAVRCAFSHGLKSKDFGRLFEVRHWEHLERIEDYSGSRFSDTDIAVVVNSMARVRSLKVMCSEFGELAFKALADHAYGWSVLEELDIRSCKTVTSRMIISILEKCPKLARIRGGTLEGQDVIDGQSWACSVSLKFFDVSITSPSDWSGVPRPTCFEHSVVAPSTKAEQGIHTILSRLSTLTHLKFLNLWSLPEYVEGKSPLPISLQFGMDQLKTMTQLREVRLTGCSRFMGDEELVWMSEHWPRIQKKTIQH